MGLSPIFSREVDNASEVNLHRAGKQYEHFIAADASGNTVGYDSEDLVSQTREPFHFVGRRFIKGKVMRIGWPLRRAGPVQ